MIRRVESNVPLKRVV